MSYDGGVDVAGSTRSSDLRLLGSSLDRRFWVVAGFGTFASFLVLGVPSAVIANPFFIRMTPTEPMNVVVLILSAPLTGLLIATYLASGGAPRDVHAGGGTGRVTLGGVGAYLAIGCPICNKIVVAALGVSGALNVFAPLQPVIGAVSVAFLAGMLTWRLRTRARGCERCTIGLGAGSSVTPPAPSAQ